MRGERRSREPSRPRRQRALRTIGAMRNFGLPRWRTTLRIEIVGGIDVADERGLICKSLDIEMRIAANPHVSDIDVTIDSIGGDVKGAMRIYHALRAHPATVTTTARGYCCSSATIILLAGSWREAAAGTKLLLHSVAIRPSDRRWTHRAHAWAAQEWAATDEWLAGFYAERTRGKIELWRQEMKNEGYMSIDRACDLGLVYCQSGEAIIHAGRRYAWPRG